MASRAFRTRFRMTCWTWTRSARTMGVAASRSSRTPTFRMRASLWTRRATSRTSAFRFKGTRSGSPFFKSSRSRPITSPARLSSSTTSVRMSRSSARSGCAAFRSMRAAWALAMIAARGWFSSWASEVAITPIVETRRKWASSCRLRSASASACRRSVVSVWETMAPPCGRWSGRTCMKNQRSPVGVPYAYSSAKPSRAPSRTSSMPRQDGPGLRIALRRRLPADPEVVHPHSRPLGSGGRRRAPQPRPPLVHGDDAPLAVEHRHPARQRREDRGLHRLARAQGVFRLLACQRARQHLGHQAQLLDVLGCPLPRIPWW